MRAASRIDSKNDAKPGFKFDGSMQRWVRDDRFAGKGLTTVQPLRCGGALHGRHGSATGALVPRCFPLEKQPLCSPSLISTLPWHPSCACAAAPPTRCGL